LVHQQLGDQLSGIPAVQIHVTGSLPGLVEGVPG
jgi:hypothetical protein